MPSLVVHSARTPSMDLWQVRSMASLLPVERWPGVELSEGLGAHPLLALGLDEAGVWGDVRVPGPARLGDGHARGVVAHGRQELDGFAAQGIGCGARCP